jgi:hypothetical protein
MEVVIVWVVLSFAAAVYAGSKGRSGVGFFFLSILLSPLIAFVWIAVSPSNPRAMGLRKCPQCAEWVKDEALKCRFCSFDFSAPVMTIAAELSSEQFAPRPSKEVAAEPSLKWFGIVAALVVFGVIVFWSVQFVSVKGAKANEESAIASMRLIPTACSVYQTSYSHGYPAKLSFLGPPPIVARPDDFGADLIDGALASGTKDGYVFEYRAGRQVRGEIRGFKVVARPISRGTGRSFYVDETAVIRHGIGLNPDKFSSPL